MSKSESNYRVKRSKRVANKRTKAITPKSSNPNQVCYMLWLCYKLTKIIQFYLKCHVFFV